MRVAFSVALISTISAFVDTPARAATCSNKVHSLSGGTILAQSVLYARPGQDDALYRGTLAQAQALKEHGFQTFTVYRGPGGAQPAVVWEIAFPNFRAHDGWFHDTDKMRESAAEKANDKNVDAATMRFEHRHYVLREGWWQNSC